MRRILLVLLGFGVFAGYGSAIAGARWHARHHAGSGGCERRWDRDSQRGSERSEDARPAVAPAPQTIVMPQAAPAAPQIFLIMPGAQAAPVVPQVITVPAPAAAPAQAPAPTPASP